MLEKETTKVITTHLPLLQSLDYYEVTSNVDKIQNYGVIRESVTASKSQEQHTAS